MNFNVKAIDDGYGDTKCSSTNSPFLIPSFVSGFRPKPSDEFESDDSERHDYISSIVNNEKYIVGKAAYKLDQNIQWVGGENKHNDSRFPVLFKTCLGLMSNQPYEQIDTLVMGLPVKAENENRIEQLTQIAKQRHVVDLSFDGESYSKRTIDVKNVIVKNQPFGSLCDVILNHKGEIINKEVAKGFNVIVDVGARTVNILTVESLQRIDDLTTHSNDGMFTAYNEVSKFLEKELDVTIPDGKLPQIIESKELNGFDLTDLIESSYYQLANQIKNMVEKLIINSKGFITSIVFTGGGSELLQPYLDQMFMDHHCIFLDRYSTVKGLKKYGIRQMQKEEKDKVHINVGR